MPLRELVHSIRFGVPLAVVLLGLVGLSVALLTGERYKQLIRQSESRSLTEWLSYEVQQDLRKHHAKEIQLAQHLQRHPGFHDAARQGESDTLVDQLDEQFEQYMVTAGELHLAELRLYDRDFTLLARSSQQARPFRDQPACAELIGIAATRQSHDRLKLFSGLCEHDRQVLSSTLVPIGGLRPFGYLAVIADPVPQLMGISAEMHSPMEVRLANGTVLQRAGSRPEPTQGAGWTTASQVMLTPTGQRAFSVHVRKNGGELAALLAQTRLTLTVGSIGLTLLAVLIALLILRRTLLAPLSRLTDQVRRITDSREHLDTDLEVSGSTEIQHLAQAFNGMSAELARLYRELQQLAFSDPLTRLPNRAWFHDNLQRLANQTDRGGPGFALLFIDLDKFKPINDILGHQAGDQALKLVAGRILTVLRGGDFLARFNGLPDGAAQADALARMGGDEFAILLPATEDAASAERVAEKITAAVTRPLKLEGQEVRLGTSIGIALYPADAPTVKELVHRADLAMYGAKSGGGGYAHCAATERSKSSAGD